MTNGWNHCKLLMMIYIGYWVNLIGCFGRRYFQLPMISITHSVLLCYQVVFDVSLQRFLDSYLRLASRYKRGWLLCVLLKALPPVCMKYTARGESWVANIARGEAECYICHETLTKSCILSYKRSGSVLSVLLYFTLEDVLTEDTPLKFNTFIE